MTRHAKSLYMKFFMVILLFFVLPLSLLFSYGYRHLESFMMQKIEMSNETNLEQMNSAIQRVIDRTNQTANYLSTNVRLNSLLRTYNQQIPSDIDFSYSSNRPSYMEKYVYLQLAIDVQDILENYADNWLDSDCQIGLILNDGQVFTSWSSFNTDFDQLNAILSDNDDGRMFFTPTHDSFIRYDSQVQYFTFVRHIYDIENAKSSLARLVITTPLKVIEDIIYDHQTNDLFSLYLVNHEQKVMFSLSGNNSITSFTPDCLDYEKNSIINTNITGLNWTLYYVVPYNVVFAETISLRHTMVSIFIICFLIIAALCFLLIYRLLAPLRQLTAGMNRAKQGDWDMPPLPITSQDEIGTLTNGFNLLMSELHHTLEQVKESERQKSELRFEMLLAQINPHFLFNTLNSIKWMATMVHADNIVNTIRSLARLLEISMNRQADCITIGEELKNLKSYLDIQAIRYTDLFDVTYEIVPDLESYETLKLVFQPIVENSIIHNIQEQEHLSVHIRGVKEQERIIFEIKDNGKGMTADQVHRLLAEDHSNAKNVFRGIGVRNVHQRLHQKYGSEYGLRIDSSPGSGTTVQIVFPAIKMENSLQTI